MNPLKAFVSTLTGTESDVVENATKSIYDIEINSLINY